MLKEVNRSWPRTKHLLLLIGERRARRVETGGMPSRYDKFCRRWGLCLEHPFRAAVAVRSCAECLPVKRRKIRAKRRAETIRHAPGGPHVLAWNPPLWVRERWSIDEECQWSVCAYCGLDIQRKPRGKEIHWLWTWDHIVPLSRGGRDVWENLVPACRSCNSSKGTKFLWREWTPKNPVDLLRRLTSALN